MCEVDYILGALDSVLKVSSSLDLVLLQLHSTGEGALELIYRLAVGTEVKESDLGIILASKL